MLTTWRPHVVWRMRQFYVYLLTDKRHTVIYTGVTNDLARRLFQHRHGEGGRFTRKYRLHKLVYFEVFADSYNAISREKQIKTGSRARKERLISAANADGRDLLPGG
jgi:putative endonuclease